MLSAESIKIILGRQDHTLDNTRDFDSLRSEKILVTGGMGSLGETLCDQFLNHQIDFLVTDIETLDVTSRDNVLEVLQKYKPTVIVHLAADKHAPQGELDPHSTFRINTVGTENIIWATKELRSEYLPKIVLASTCKSCDPETVYGASKLIAERLILNSGNSVVRFYNVIETAGNVFQIWESVPSSEEILVTPCSRFFISKQEALSLLVKVVAISASQRSEKGGRYTLNPGDARQMESIAEKLYPDRQLKKVMPRRGDRLREPLMSNSETFEVVDTNFWRIISPHDSL